MTSGIVCHKECSKVPLLREQAILKCKCATHKYIDLK